MKMEEDARGEMLDEMLDDLILMNKLDWRFGTCRM